MHLDSERLCRLTLILLVLASGSAVAQSTPAVTTVDFENVSGPSLFGSVAPPLTISSATFSGGQILTDATYLPADPTSVYGTAYFCSGCAPTITIDFAEKVANFSILLLNGQTFTVTYTIEDDQSSQQQISLVANSSGGAATVTLPDSNIRQVVISGNTDSWDFEIDNVQFSPSQLALLDPVSSQFLTEYSSGAQISTDTDVLATGGTLVQGATADGVTQVLVRVPTAQVGQSVSLSLTDENGNSDDVASIGGLFVLGGQPSSAASSLTVSSVDTSAGPQAFAVFLAPVNFSRGSPDDILSQRTVTLQAQGAVTTSSTVNITRPPVLLVHGLWDKAATWNSFTALVADPMNRFYLGRADYSNIVSGISATDPTYSSVNLKKIQANSIGFAYNAPSVEKTLRAFINAYKFLNNVAAVQADVVGHSMGGDVSRTLAELSDFTRPDTYGVGPIHKLITIGTPHLGSPLAIDLLQSTGNCAASVLARFSQPSFTTLTIAGSTVSGAVGDLEGTGDGSNLSSALTTMQATPLPFPVAYIAGKSSASNLAQLGVGTFSTSSILGRAALWQEAQNSEER